MANEVWLIDELRRLADLTPPICVYDRPEETEIFGKKITVYCKPFEQFQRLLRQAADRIEKLESLRPKGRWEMTGKHLLPYRCTNCCEENDGRTKFCPECGAEMEE